MKKTKPFLMAAIVGFAVGPLCADTIELAKGTLFEGEFIGSSNGIIMFNTGEGIEAFPHDQVVAVYLSAGVATAEALAAKAAAPTPTAADVAPVIAEITVPTGTRLVIRTTEEVDSGRHSAGHRFRGQLEGALVVDGVTVAPRGAFVHGRITQASASGRVAGSSNLGIEFSDIMLEDQLFPISTGEMQSQSTGEAGRTVRRTARAAAVGGLIGGSSGARTGARVGAGASILTSGSTIQIPRGTILETTLTAPLIVPR